MLSRKQIVDAARSYKGVRFRHQGRTRVEGIDCAGLVILVGNEFGVVNFQADNYSTRTNGNEFCQYFYDAGLKDVPFDDLQPGDVVLTKTRDFPAHCGFVGEKHGQLSFIHAYKPRRKVTEEYLSQWEHVVSHCLRFPAFMES